MHPKKMNASSVEKMLELYNKGSKHSNYQVMPSKLWEIINPEYITVCTRFEKERLDYIVQHLNIKDSQVIDIGGNTGFFTFELIEQGAKLVSYYEGNRDHAEFVKEAALALDYESKIKVLNQYVAFEENSFPSETDIMLVLNVLHHIGDDYGDQTIAKDIALDTIAGTIQKLASSAKYLVLQLGFNWKGNRDTPLFERGTKQELIKFVKTAADKYWNIDHIGVPVKNGTTVTYVELDNTNIERNDNLGEFLNRPIFIMSSRRFSS